MTTIVSVRTNSGDDGIVLGVDSQLSIWDGDQRTSKIEDQKLFVGKNCAFSFAGNMDPLVYRFARYLIGRSGSDRDPEQFLRWIYQRSGTPPYGSDLIPRDVRARLETLSSAPDRGALEKVLVDISTGVYHAQGPVEEYVAQFVDRLRRRPLDPIDHAIATRQFWEFYEVNRLFHLAGTEAEALPEMILASNGQHMQLYHVDALGNVRDIPREHEFGFLTLGSGASLVRDYFLKEKYHDDLRIPDALRAERIRPDNISMEIAGWLVYGALKEAWKDGDSGGYLDWVAITRKGVVDCGSRIRKRLAILERDAMQAELEALKSSTSVPVQ